MSSSAANTHARPKTWLIVMCLLSVYVVWGTTYFALKVGVLGSPPYFLIGTRFVVAGGLLIAWLMLRGQALPTLRQWAGASLVGLLLLTIGLGNVTVAEQWVSSGAAVALISSMPLATALWTGLFGRWPQRWEWVAIVLGLAGTLVMILGQDFRVSPLGTLLILSGSTAWSFGSVLSKRLELPHGAMGFAAEMFAGGILCLIVSVVRGEHWALPDSNEVWAAWAYLVIAGSLIAFSAYRFLVDRVSPTLAATYAYVNPPVALAVGWWLGNESFSPNVLIGLPIVLGAVGLLTWVQFRSTHSDAAQSLDSQDARVCGVRAAD